MLLLLLFLFLLLCQLLLVSELLLLLAARRLVKLRVFDGYRNLTLCHLVCPLVLAPLGAGGDSGGACVSDRCHTPLVNTRRLRHESVRPEKCSLAKRNLTQLFSFIMHAALLQHQFAKLFCSDSKTALGAAAVGAAVKDWGQVGALHRQQKFGNVGKKEESKR